MWAFYVLLAPLVALIVWGVVYDIKRRRRGVSPTSDYDVEAVAKRLGAGRRDGRIPEPGPPPTVGDIFGP